MTALPALDHDHFMRLAFRVAEESHRNGQHPFGAILVGADGTVLMEQGNGYMPNRDMTGHAERVLMTRAGIEYGPEFLAGCTMYTSAEPCAMCAGAAYWVGLGRVVYGLSERQLKDITGNHPENPTLDLSCEIVFAAGQRHVEVVGPILVEEAQKLHEGVW
ncbi:nucleoside deaminase [Kaistia dalseonensis]|uniref:tRNA(Arg) A34 adenosine deaminase TadA n=1 Tax=Kaistia dalseonensis TaxID=410840 RepID=A0ABU0H6H2_9HYPH|nr:nucleoside deaminase [Kaistia dalseonensis]MCX5495313.1 nucleoside deaminase [Kaistia dalseonensis]MDQ0437899.1 tRNA(Arg) A34 adenosine deaminase TadA [Kaistia dalseonensis]